MATTRNKRVPMQEQIKLINECRKSGLTDADWCRENGIAPSTFYNWVSRCRKTAADIQEPNYGHHETPQPQTPLNLDNSYTIEVVVNDITIRITNSADPILLTQTIKLLRMLPY